MNLEPEVTGRIRQHRFWRSFYKVLLVLPSVSACVFLLGLSALVIGGMSYLKALTCVGFAVVIALYIALRTYVGERSNYRSFFVEGRSRVPPRLDRKWSMFESAIESVSIAVGIETPRLVCLGIPSMSTVSFEANDGSVVVGVTERTLEMGLSAQETEAIMAHEVSNLVAGNIVRPPSFWSFKSVSFFMGCVVVGLVLVVFIDLGSTCRHQGFWGSNAGSITIVAALLAILVVVYALLLKGFRSKSAYEVLLADSVAIKITGNPGAMESALEKLALEGTLRRIDTNSFRPYRLFFRGDPGYVRVSTWDPWGDIDRRLENLEAIKKGRWPLFEGEDT